jgi:hypothetical protein
LDGLHENFYHIVDCKCREIRPDLLLKRVHALAEANNGGSSTSSSDLRGLEIYLYLLGPLSRKIAAAMTGASVGASAV